MNIVPFVMRKGSSMNNADNKNKSLNDAMLDIMNMSDEEFEKAISIKKYSQFINGETTFDTVSMLRES